METKFQGYIEIAMAYGLAVGTKVVGAILLWIIGRFVIKGLLKLLDRSTGLRKIDETLARYLHSVVSVLLNILLFVSVLSVFGVETTTFAGLLAAAGVAIGVAWSGLLSNLAAGVFMIVLRPFRAGDDVTAAGVSGKVHSIGLFVTAIDTGDNVRVTVGNGKIFSEIIQNYSTNPYRRVEVKAQLAHDADHDAALRVLREKLPQIPSVMTTPAPGVEIVDLTAAGPVISVSAFAPTGSYGAVHLAMVRLVLDELGKLKLPVPGQHHHVYQRTT